MLAESFMIADARLRSTVVGKGKAIRKDLIHYPVLKPCGGLKIPAVDRQAETVLRAVAKPGMDPVRCRAEPEHLFAGLQTEAIPEGSLLIRCRECNAPAVLGLLHEMLLLKAVAENLEHRSNQSVRLDPNLKRQILPCPNGAERTAVLRKAQVMPHRRYALLQLQKLAQQSQAPPLQHAQSSHSVLGKRLPHTGQQIGVDGLHFLPAVVHQDAQTLGCKDRSSLSRGRQRREVLCGQSGGQKAP